MYSKTLFSFKSLLSAMLFGSSVQNMVLISFSKCDDILYAFKQQNSFQFRTDTSLCILGQKLILLNSLLMNQQRLALFTDNRDVSD